MRLTLYLKVYLLRLIQSLSAWVERTLIKPKPIRPDSNVKISTSSVPGSLQLYFYLRKGHRKKDLPLIVNFHGGGFVIGHAKDDARWATALLSRIDAVFVSVGYRKGPEYPQPTAVQDGVDAMNWLWRHADEYGFDPHLTVVTGFSSGGNMSFTVPLLHNKNSSENGKIAGIVAFYPSVNQAIPRAQKFASNRLSKDSEPQWLHNLIDESYYQNLPEEGRASIYLSPALASEEAVLGLPKRIAIFTCEGDKLLVEGEEFREHLTRLGKNVGGRMIEGVEHAFDKKNKHIEKRERLYEEAVKQIKLMVV